MKSARALPVCVALISGNVLGVELALGVTEVPACTPARAGPRDIAKSRSSRAKASQKASVTAIVEGKNTQEPANVRQMQTCADAAAKKVDLRLLAAQPVEGNPLFKDIFLQCVEESRIPVKVYFVALKLEDKCSSEEKNSR